MATNYVPLDEAARILGVSPERLVEMRSQGQLRGFKDGASWKFPQEEIERLRDEGLEPMGSDIGLSIDDGAENGGSDVALVAGLGEGSDVQLVSRSGSPLELVDDDDDEYQLSPEGTSKLDLGADATEGSTGPVIGGDELLSAEDGGTAPQGSDLRIQGDSGVDVLSDIDLSSVEKGGTGDLIHGDSDPNLSLGSGIDDALSEDDDLVIAEDDDDLVLSSAGSDISIAGDSGINLMSPSDSGLSLENEPLDLAGSSISALDLGNAPISSPSAGGSGSGSLVDFQADEEFQLSPSSVGIEVEDDDSGSQVIEVEDSAAFVGDVDFGQAVAEPVAAGGLLDDSAVMVEEDAFGAEDAGVAVDEGFGGAQMVASGGGGGPVALETPFSIWQVAALACMLVLLCICGMVMTDLIRNMWTYSETAAPVSSLTDALISMFGFDS